jgi:hypothetical protein
MEIAELLGLTPRQALATLMLPEFLAYSKLGADRADEMDEAKGEAGIDLSQMEPGAIASMFGAEMV